MRPISPRSKVTGLAAMNPGLAPEVSGAVPDGRCRNQAMGSASLTERMMDLEVGTGKTVAPRYAIIITFRPYSGLGHDTMKSEITHVASGPA